MCKLGVDLAERAVSCSKKAIVKFSFEEMVPVLNLFPEDSF